VRHLGESAGRPTDDDVAQQGGFVVHQSARLETGGHQREIAAGKDQPGEWLVEVVVEIDPLWVLGGEPAKPVLERFAAGVV